MKRFFKKYSPKTNLILSNGSLAKFSPVDQNFGVMETEDQWLQGEFDKAIREQRGGVSEIKEEEYRDLLEKKNQRSSPHWREEFGNRPTPVQARTLKPQEEPAPVVAVNQPVPTSVLTQNPPAKPRATKK